jgi:hypothetical protein
MTVDQSTGFIWIVFYDRRNDISNNNSTDVFLAKSTDGGNSFANFIVSTSPFIPVPGVFFGDYTSISAVNNIVRPVWARLQGSNQSIVTAIVNDNTSAINNLNESIPDKYLLGQNYPNPFNPVTNISYSLKANGFVILKIYDALGREIETLVNKNQNAGKYNVEWNAESYSSGVYFYKLETKNFSDVKSMVLIK